MTQASSNNRRNRGQNWRQNWCAIFVVLVLAWLAIWAISTNSAISTSLAISSALAAQQTVALEYPDHIPVGPTDSKPVQIEVNVTQGFHVQANPASRENLVPTELIFDPSPQLAFSSPVYPKGIPFRLNPVGSEILTYSGSFQIGVLISRQKTAVKSASPSPAKSTLVKGKLHYQACDEKTCLRPSAVPFEFWVENP